ncbi:hypothetical protein D4Q76_02990 [archaeon]|nr:MAG: hypothetical protein D4Q76_02990 [archaeon]
MGFFIIKVDNMPRKASESFMNSVISAVDSEPSSILEIANNAGTSWESTKKALGFLESLGVIQSKQEGSRKQFFKRDFIEDLDNRNWFGLPLKKTDKDNINFIFGNAKNIWKEKSGSDAGRTQMQKVLVAVNKECNLNIPVGRYLYGMMTVMPFKIEEQYAIVSIPNSNQILNSVKSAVERYHMLSVTDLKIQHYKETNNVLYLAKEASLKILYKEGFDKGGFSNFCESLFVMLSNMPKEEPYNLEIFTEFVGVVNRLSQLEENDLNNIKNEIGSAFNEVWKFIALNFFLKDLREFYSVQQLRQINKEIIDQVNAVDEQLSLLNDFVPEKENPRYPEYEELKKLQGSVKDSSKVLRKFDLD